jgi:membrane protease YdiL (CAAX protease family)
MAMETVSENWCHPARPIGSPAACSSESFPPDPLGATRTLVYFAVPTLALWFGTRVGVPWIHAAWGGPDILAWFFVGKVLFASLFFAAIIAYWREGRALRWKEFSARFRLTQPTWNDVAISLLVLFGCGLGTGAILGVWNLVADGAGWVHRAQLAPDFVSMAPLTAETWWILLAWLPMFFFNIAGEELWWRGYLLPRQERGQVGYAWLIHGAGLALFHLPFGLDLTIALAPFLWGLPWIVSRRRNLWTGFIVHGLLNGGGFLAVAFGLA